LAPANLLLAVYDYASLSRHLSFMKNQFMKIIVFGATGSVGRQLVEQALQAGHTVTAFTRNGEKLKDLAHAQLCVVEGDVLRAEQVREGVRGHDAVFCALGAGRKGNVRALGTKNILAAMKEEGVSRFICQTTLGAGDSRGNLNFFWKNIMFGWLLKEAYIDHEQQEKFILQSPLDWTVVRPAAFTNGRRTGSYQHGFSALQKRLKLKISRADVADFMLRQLGNGEYRRKAVGLSY
jgi:putative NADH-flavin reductase